MRFFSGVPCSDQCKAQPRIEQPWRASTQTGTATKKSDTAWADGSDYSRSRIPFERPVEADPSISYAQITCNRSVAASDELAPHWIIVYAGA